MSKEGILVNYMEEIMNKICLKNYIMVVIGTIFMYSSTIIFADEDTAVDYGQFEQDESLLFDGVIEPNKIVDVGSAAQGIISDITVDRSDVIEAGQDLASLQSHVELATLELARTQANNQALTDLELRYVNHEFNKRKLARAEALYTKKAISLQLKDEAKTEADLSKLQLRQAADNKKVS